MRDAAASARYRALASSMLGQMIPTRHTSGSAGADAGVGHPAGRVPRRLAGDGPGSGEASARCRCRGIPGALAISASGLEAVQPELDRLVERRSSASTAFMPGVTSASRPASDAVHRAGSRSRPGSGAGTFEASMSSYRLDRRTRPRCCPCRRLGCQQSGGPAGSASGRATTSGSSPGTAGRSLLSRGDRARSVDCHSADRQPGRRAPRPTPGRTPMKRVHGRAVTSDRRSGFTSRRPACGASSTRATPPIATILDEGLGAGPSRRCPGLWPEPGRSTNTSTPAVTGRWRDLRRCPRAMPARRSSSELEPGPVP